MFVMETGIAHKAMMNMQVTCVDKEDYVNIYLSAKNLRCVHLHSVCDGIEDCPLNDDETLCQLKEHICPIQCTCLNLAIVCNGNLIEEQLLYRLPYISFYITHTHINHFRFLNLNKLLLTANFSNNRITEVCSIGKKTS